MTTIFTRIIDGEIPGRFVWRDEHVVAFLPIALLAPGHTLVVPVAEVDHWLDADPSLMAHLFDVARAIGLAQREVLRCSRVGLIVAGYEVPHLHVHVVPTTSMAQFDFESAATSVDRDDLEATAEAIRAELRRAGHPEVADA